VISDADPHFLRTTFDDSPELYDRSRAVAPQQLFDDLIALAKLEPGARLLEIGCGTGQATLPLAERGFEIVAIEPGASLADLARRKLAPFPCVNIVVSSFEQWNPLGARFDGVVAFNSFHWIDPDRRFAKPAEVPREGGALAVVGMRFVVHDHADAVWMALQEDYEEVAGVVEPRTHVDAVKDRSAEFEASGYFRNVTARRYLWDISFDADSYIGLLQTSSWHRRLDDDVRAKLFERIHDRVRAQAEQTITPTMCAALYVAENGAGSDFDLPRLSHERPRRSP
jgi:SAM-dependent methyltransferase